MIGDASSARPRPILESTAHGVSRSIRLLSESIYLDAPSAKDVREFRTTLRLPRIPNRGIANPCCDFIALAFGHEKSPVSFNTGLWVSGLNRVSTESQPRPRVNDVPFRMHCELACGVEQDDCWDDCDTKNIIDLYLLATSKLGTSILDQNRNRFRCPPNKTTDSQKRFAKSATISASAR